MRPFPTPPIDETLADLIYEAAFDPDRWADALAGLAAITGSESGAVMTYRGVQPLAGRAIGTTREALALSLEVTPDQTRRRMEHVLANPIFGFVDGAEYFPAETRDVVDDKLAELGIGEQIGTIVRLAGDDLAVVVLHRRTADGPFAPERIALADAYHGHIARAALVAARLGLERAKATTSALNALGVPAAVMSENGRVRASNALIDEVSGVLTPLAFGGMAIVHAPADALFQEAVRQSGGRHDGAVRSIAIPARDGGDALVLHLVPLRRSAYDIFSGADVLVALTRVSPNRASPAPGVLAGLFDLTPAEARLACALARGLPLKAAAADNHVRHSTARAYLEQIFRKTGTHRQSELVLLLDGAQPLG